MQYDKLFQLLSRNDVKEIALQTGRPPCVLVGDQYSPVLQRNFSEDDLIGMLVAANGRAEVMGLIEGPRRWDYTDPSIGVVRVTAGYHSSVLQARFKLVERAPHAAPAPEPGAGRQPPPAPSRAISSSVQERPSQVKEPPAASRERPSQVKEPPGISRERPSQVKDPGPTRERPSQVQEWADMPSSPRPAGGRPDEPRAAAGARPGSAGLAPDLPVPDEEAAGAAQEIFQALLELSRSRRASDLHILADRPPMLRIAGELVPLGDPLPAPVVEDMLLAQVPPSVRAELDQHGACDFALIHPTLGRFRANVTRQRTGMKLTARPIRDQVPTLAELGLPESIAHATHHHQGLIVVTGPTGHGKTTTLAAIVDVINRERTHHIITVEDPIEYVHPRKRSVISQRQVGAHTKTFAAALKGSLREDPDVIVVGELRDTETVRMALSASETGHLVISTMNTPSAAKAIERLIDLFPPGDQPQVRMTLAGGLRLIISQRLVPSADGQEVCAACEVLPGVPPLWALIRDNKTFQIPSLQQRGKSLGIIRLDDSLADLVKLGRTSLEIAKEYAEAPDQLEGLVAAAKKK